MDTQDEFRSRLLGLGINREKRTLASWREKGLLPPLQRVGRGRARGVKQTWSEDSLEQAIAAHFLINRSGSVDETLLGLWLAGYEVDPGAARAAWLARLAQVHKRRQKAGSRLSGGLIALGTRWWQTLSRQTVQGHWLRETIPSGDLKLISQFFGETQEWVHDDVMRDDTAYRDLIVELVIRGTEGSIRREDIDQAWDDLAPSTWLVHSSYVAFVQSLSEEELRKIRESLTDVARALQRTAIAFGTADYVSSVHIRAVLMGDLLGTSLARLLVAAMRAPESPFSQSILTVHQLLIRVQYIDITRKTDVDSQPAEWIRREWEVTKRQLAKIWDENQTAV